MTILFTYGLNGVQTGAIGRFVDLWVERRFQDVEELGAVVVADWKADLLIEDAEVRFRDDVWFVDRLTLERSGAQAVTRVQCAPLWRRLADAQIIGVLPLQDVSPLEGARLILAAADGEARRWTASSDPVPSVETFTYELADMSALAALRAWAAVTGQFLRFNTSARDVIISAVAGVDRGAGFRYGRNVLTVKRTHIPPAHTRVYAYGADGLGLTGVTGGEPYIQDLDWYVGMGVSAPVAEERYVKSRRFTDTSIVDEDTLLRRAEEVLAGGATGQLSYEMTVADLSALLGVIEPFSVGDTVRVADQPLGVDVRTTVVRTREHPLEPHRNTVELQYLQPTRPGLPQGATTGGGTRSWLLFGHKNGSQYVLRNNATYILNRIPLRFREGGEAELYHQLRFVGVGSGALSVSAFDAESGVLVRPIMSIPYQHGEVVDRSLTATWFQSLSGLYDYRVRVAAIATGGPSPASGVNVAVEESSFHAHTYGAVRQSPTPENSRRFDFIGQVVQRFTVPDGVTVVRAEVVGASGGVAGVPGGGGGGRVVVSFPVVPGTTYDVRVPEFGARNGNGSGSAWPGGGLQGFSSGRFGGAGGGYAAVTPAGLPVAQSIIVAGGGGGGGDSAFSGGGGGYPNGQDGPSGGGFGGTGAAGGAPTGDMAGTPATAGSALQGGSGQAYPGDPFARSGGGGGGGWFGGGGGGGLRGGGGGSGYIGDAIEAFDIETTDGFQSGNGYVEFTWADPA